MVFAAKEKIQASQWKLKIWVTYIYHFQYLEDSSNEIGVDSGNSDFCCGIWKCVNRRKIYKTGWTHAFPVIDSRYTKMKDAFNM